MPRLPRLHVPGVPMLRRAPATTLESIAGDVCRHFETTPEAVRSTASAGFFRMHAHRSRYALSMPKWRHSVVWPASSIEVAQRCRALYRDTGFPQT
jgi:hypothetical protein